MNLRTCTRLLRLPCAFHSSGQSAADTDTIAGKRALPPSPIGTVEGQLGKVGTGSKHLTATANLSRQLSRYFNFSIDLPRSIDAKILVDNKGHRRQQVSLTVLNPFHHVVKSCPPSSQSCCRSDPVCCPSEKNRSISFDLPGACSSSPFLVF